jgi:hypothetical protein
LVDAFEPQAGQPSPRITVEENSGNKQLADLAVSAFRSNDLVTVSSTLQTMHSTAAMTDD